MILSPPDSPDAEQEEQVRGDGGQCGGQPPARPRGGVQRGPPPRPRREVAPVRQPRQHRARPPRPPGHQAPGAGVQPQVLREVADEIQRDNNMK